MSTTTERFGPKARGKAVRFRSVSDSRLANLVKSMVCRHQGWTLARLAALLAALLAGCGASAVRRASGAAVFAESCSVCHSLGAEASAYKQGGDLIGYHMSRESLTEFTREMPVRHRLSAPELAAVVGYVDAAERAGGP